MSERFEAEQIKQHWPAADQAAIDILFTAKYLLHRLSADVFGIALVQMSNHHLQPLI